MRSDRTKMYRVRASPSGDLGLQALQGRHGQPFLKIFRRISSCFPLLVFTFRGCFSSESRRLCVGLRKTVIVTEGDGLRQKPEQNNANQRVASFRIILLLRGVSRIGADRGAGNKFASRCFVESCYPDEHLRRFCGFSGKPQVQRRIDTDESAR